MDQCFYQDVGTYSSRKIDSQRRTNAYKWLSDVQAKVSLIVMKSVPIPTVSWDQKLSEVQYKSKRLKIENLAQISVLARDTQEMLEEIIGVSLEELTLTCF